MLTDMYYYQNKNARADIFVGSHLHGVVFIFPTIKVLLVTQFQV